MMGRQSGQLGMMILDMEDLIPANHLLRRINEAMSFNFIYEILAPYYPSNGRPSVNPVSMFKMLHWISIRSKIGASAGRRGAVKSRLSLVLWV